MTNAQWRALLRKGRRADEPGQAFARLQDGRTVFEDVWGRASLELPADLDRLSVFNMGSLAKQFVAACLHSLELQGKLSLDDRLRKHLPELPKVYEPVRLRHLLWHTSGVLCYTTLLWWSGRFDRAGMNRAQALDLLKRQTRLNFKPGSRYLYGNSNYLLLTEVIERLERGGLAPMAEKQIFKPLGMRQTHFRVLRGRPIPHLAVGHWGGPGQWRVNLHTGATAGPGRLMSSLADLERWARAWSHPTKALAPILARMRRRGSLDDGGPIRYGSGLMWQDYRGLAMIRHDGFTAGCRSEICHLPELSATLICVGNRTDISPTWAIRKAIDAAWPGRLKAHRVWPQGRPDRPRKGAASPARTRRRAGLYAQEGAARAFELAPLGRGLVYQSYKTRFALKADAYGGYQGLESGAIARIDFDGAGRARLLQKGREEWYRPLRQRPADPRRDKALLGTWRCVETGARIRYSLEGGKILYHDENWAEPIRCMQDGSYYMDQMRISVQGRRMRHESEDAWVLRLNWVRSTGDEYAG